MHVCSVDEVLCRLQIQIIGRTSAYGRAPLWNLFRPVWLEDHVLLVEDFATDGYHKADITHL